VWVQGRWYSRYFPVERRELEQTIREACQRQDWQAAATHALRGYGPEVLGFLVGLQNSEQRGREVFSTFCEDLWRGLPGFGWDCSLRTWIYCVARHACFREKRNERRRPRGIPLSQAPAVAELALQLRSGTHTYQRTEVKERVRRLREALPNADRMLLILRVDREMSWRDLARVVLGGSPSPVELEREAVRLRKRFQLVKERLRDGLREGARRSG
jgi:RNA polymerase sigma-70 factor, ECF subfamily